MVLFCKLCNGNGLRETFSCKANKSQANQTLQRKVKANKNSRSSCGSQTSSKQRSRLRCFAADRCRGAGSSVLCQGHTQPALTWLWWAAADVPPSSHPLDISDGGIWEIRRVSLPGGVLVGARAGATSSGRPSGETGSRPGASSAGKHRAPPWANPVKRLAHKRSS